MGTGYKSDIEGIVSEKEFQREVVKIARRFHWKVYHTYDSRKSEPGFPDLVLVRKRVIFAELKTKAGKVSDAQQGWLTALLKAGAEAYIWKPSDLKGIVRCLSIRA